MEHFFPALWGGFLFGQWPCSGPCRGRVLWVTFIWNTVSPVPRVGVLFKDALIKGRLNGRDYRPNIPLVSFLQQWRPSWTPFSCRLTVGVGTWLTSVYICYFCVWFNVLWFFCSFPVSHLLVNMMAIQIWCLDKIALCVIFCPTFITFTCLVYPGVCLHPIPHVLFVWYSWTVNTSPQLLKQRETDSQPN